MERRIAVRIERAEHDPLGQSETVQQLRDEPVGTALADVVQADVEFVLPATDIPPEGL